MQQKNTAERLYFLLYAIVHTSGGEGPCRTNFEFFICFDDTSDLFLHRGYSLADLLTYNNL